jgi:uncharacterized protein YbjQ (UPF0145 family)
VKERLVFSVVVKSKHFLSDFFMTIKNIIGMNLTGYESMIEDAIEEAYQKLLNNFPDVYSVKIGTTQVTNGAAELIVYGYVKVDK